MLLTAISPYQKVDAEKRYLVGFQPHCLCYNLSCIWFKSSAAPNFWLDASETFTAVLESLWNLRRLFAEERL